MLEPASAPPAISRLRKSGSGSSRPLNHFTAIKKFEARKSPFLRSIQLNDSFTEPEIDRGFEIGGRWGPVLPRRARYRASGGPVRRSTNDRGDHNHSDVRTE